MDIFELKLQVTFDDVLFLLGCLGVFESKEAMAMYVKAPMKPDPDHVGYCKGLQQKLYDALRRSCKERVGTAQC
jgi:hypothetical protein